MSRPSLLFKTFSGNDNESSKSLVGTDFLQNMLSPNYVTGFYRSSNALEIPVDLLNQDLWHVTGAPFRKEFTIRGKFKTDGWSLAGTVMTGSSGTHMIFGSSEAVRPIVHLAAVSGIGIRCYFFPTTGGSGFLDITNQNIGNGVWHEFVMEWSNANNTLKVYLDGALIGSLSSITWTFTEGNNLLISPGARFDTAGDKREWIGFIDGIDAVNEINVSLLNRNQRRKNMNDVI